MIKINNLTEFEKQEKLSTDYWCNMPEKLYHSTTPIGQSNLCKFKESAAHYKAAQSKVFKESAAMKLGTAIHCNILEPHLFAKNYAVMPKIIKSKKSVAYKEWADMFAVGKIVIDETFFNKVFACTSSVMSSQFADYFVGGNSEQVGVCSHEETGFRQKIRIDKYHSKQKVIVDLKTTGKPVASQQYVNSMADFNYHVQAAYYSDVAQQIDGDEHEYLIVAVETEPPFPVIMYMPSDETIMQGRKNYRKYLTELAECSETGIFPGYKDTIREFNLPKWAYD